ncbi:MAG: ATP-binding cassette domain-containing protein [Stagnimonas sp.]|nr:ATP-binding cassette domain-containing protein [Stagnimonas sp.]
MNDIKTGSETKETAVEIKDLRMSYGKKLIQENINFQVAKGSIFIIMGGSGCGKSTLLKHMIGLLPPAAGQVLYGETDYWAAEVEKQDEIRRHFGVLFQGSALFSTLTLTENVTMPMKLNGDAKKSDAERRDRAHELLDMVSLSHAKDLLPNEISGGMKKRAALARALALDPEFLFLDEPSAGLDPISSRKLDDLILELRDRTRATVLVVTHELPSLFAIGDDGIFLDAQSKQPIARGAPKALLETCEHPFVQAFLNREVPDGDESNE